jgi:hypothetical protein
MNKMSIFIILFFSCKTYNCDNLNKQLTNCSSKYWNLVYYNSIWGDHGTYKCSINGECIFLKVDEKKIKYILWEDGDYFQSKNNWQIINKTEIEIQGHNYEILKFSDNILVVKLKNGFKNDFEILIPSNLNLKYPANL